MGSKPHVGVVPTTIIHPTMVGVLNDLVVWVSKKALGGNDMSVVSLVPSVEKCSSSKGGSSSRFTLSCVL